MGGNCIVGLSHTAIDSGTTKRIVGSRLCDISMGNRWFGEERCTVMLGTSLLPLPKSSFPSSPPHHVISISDGTLVRFLHFPCILLCWLACCLFLLDSICTLLITKPNIRYTVLECVGDQAYHRGNRDVTNLARAYFLYKVCFCLYTIDCRASTSY